MFLSTISGGVTDRILMSFWFPRSPYLCSSVTEYTPWVISYPNDTSKVKYKSCKPLRKTAGERWKRVTYVATLGKKLMPSPAVLGGKKKSPNIYATRMIDINGHTNLGCKWRGDISGGTRKLTCFCYRLSLKVRKANGGSLEGKHVVIKGCLA